ncbi:MAG: 2-hydroxyacid dehydrogenase [Granulosicoccus sp.]|nr:2-hydroxyacid dehydrogenase [Granulosicoccus sp.]
MRKLAVIGDHFMLPDILQQKVRDVVGDDLEIRQLLQPWPDEPMEHGYAVAGMDGLKEYMGTADEIVDFIGDAELLVTHLAPMSAAMFERLPTLKFIAVTRGGPVNIDMQAAHKTGVTVVNTPGRNATAVAEFTLGAILAESRLIRVGHESIRAGQWRGDLYRTDTTGRELNEMVVGVIGYGHIGKKVVKLLRAFGSKVLVSDPYVQLSPEDIKDGVELVSFDTLLDKSDVVTMHARVTDETEKMMNADAFKRMKSDSIFINTARGPLVNYPDLETALNEGQIGSAMIDTFAVEPLPADSKLKSLPNVTLTPHIAGASVRTVTYAAEEAAEEVKRYLTDQPPRNACL